MPSSNELSASADPDYAKDILNIQKDISDIRKSMGKALDLASVPQGPSSRLNSDTLDGYQTSKPTNPSPNTIIPLGPNKQFPPSVIPTPSTGVVFLETQSPVASSTFTFTTVLQPDTRYQVVYIVLQNTANGNLQVRFNADAGANYKWTVEGINTNGGAAVSGFSNGDTKIELDATSQIGAGQYAIGDFDFSTVPGDNTFVYGTGRIGFSDANPFLVGQDGGFHYNGGAALSSITVFPSAGTITGTFKLYKIS